MRLVASMVRFYPIAGGRARPTATATRPGGTGIKVRTAPVGGVPSAAADPQLRGPRNRPGHRCREANLA